MYVCVHAYVRKGVHALTKVHEGVHVQLCVCERGGALWCAYKDLECVHAYYHVGVHVCLHAYARKGMHTFKNGRVSALAWPCGCGV